MANKPFSVNINRYDPYKAYRFLVYFEQSTTPVAGVSKVGGLKRSSAAIDYKEGGNAIVLKGLGRTTYDAIQLERGVTHDTDFQEWADYAQKLDKGSPTTSLLNLRREIRIELLNEQGTPVIRYKVHRAWVSEYLALSDLDAGGTGVALEHIKLENEGWERDESLTEPKET
jgi:phage tail-like protein